MHYINLCPHNLDMLQPDGSGIRVFPPSGTVARVVEKMTGPNEDGHYTIAMGEIVGLPEPQNNVMYIVSRPLAQALIAKGIKRDDVLITGRLIRDGSGRIIGAEGLAHLV